MRLTPKTKLKAPPKLAGIKREKVENDRSFPKNLNLHSRVIHDITTIFSYDWTVCLPKYTRSINSMSVKFVCELKLIWNWKIYLKFRYWIEKTRNWSPKLETPNFQYLLKFVNAKFMFIYIQRECWSLVINVSARREASTVNFLEINWKLKKIISRSERSFLPKSYNNFQQSTLCRWSYNPYGTSLDP